MDNPAYWLLLGMAGFGLLLVISLGIARLVGSNEDGNDDHELQEPRDDD